MQAIRTSTICIFILLLITGLGAGLVSPAYSSDDPTPAVKQGAKSIAAAEFAYWAKHNCYATFEQLIEAKMVASDTTDARRSGIYYNVAVPYNDSPQRFVVYGRDVNGAWACYVDETGLVRDAEPFRDARWYLEAVPAISIVLSYHLFEVLLALERWSVDHDSLYPADISALVDDKYLPPGYYPNPLWAAGLTKMTVQAVPLGWWSPGDFSYVPYMGESGQREGYILTVYGVDRYGGIDFNDDGLGDGFINVFSSGTQPTEWTSKTMHTAVPPVDLKDT